MGYDLRRRMCQVTNTQHRSPIALALCRRRTRAHVHYCRAYGKARWKRRKPNQLKIMIKPMIRLLNQKCLLHLSNDSYTHNNGMYCPILKLILLNLCREKCSRSNKCEWNGRCKKRHFNWTVFFNQIRKAKSSSNAHEHVCILHILAQCSAYGVVI